MKNYYLKLMSILIATISLTVSPVFAEEPLLFDDFQLPGVISGEGTHFEITESDYLNVTLDSSEQVVLFMSSSLNTIDMSLETEPAGLVTSLTVSGLLPNTTYYMYVDDYHNLTQIVTDALGSYTFSFDSALNGTVIIKDEPSTYHIEAVEGGKDCSDIGMWDQDALTCTLTNDVSEIIEIDSDGITLDGNGFSTSHDIYTYRHSEITVKNFAAINGKLIISTGYSGYVSNGITIVDNDFIERLYIHHHIDNLYIESNNIFLSEIRSAFEANRGNIGIFKNTMEYVRLSHWNHVTFAHNEVNRLIFFHVNDASVFNNLIGPKTFAIAYGWGDIYDNFITRYFNATHILYSSEPYEVNSNNIVAVEKGYHDIFRYNYYEEFDEPAEGCYDINSNGYCDSPYEIPGATSSDTFDPFARTTSIESDTTPPSTTNALSATMGDNDWYVSDVTISLVATDSTSGVDEIHYTLDDVESIISGDTATFVVNGEGVHTLTYYSVDAAGNTEAMQGPVSFRIDKTLPIISITGVTDGAEYPVCTPPEALDNIVTDAISGVSAKNATLEGGNANGVGGYTYTVIASDNAGNEADESVSYSVVYSFDGFTTPVTLDKPFKLGSTIPVKFLLSDGCGGIISNAEANISLIQLNSGEPAGDPIEGTTNVPDSSNVFRYVVEDSHYIYNLSTDNLSLGAWRINVTLDDGKVYSVDIGIK